MIRPAVLTTAAVLTLAPVSTAQEIIWDRVGVQGLTAFGGDTVCLGDIDGDGYRDLLSSCGIRTIFTTPAQLSILSGKDGRTLRLRPGPRAARLEGIAAAGDMDGDGVPDYAVSVFGPGPATFFVRVHSGKDDHVLWQVAGAVSAILGDLNLDGDGRADLVVTAVPRVQLGEVRAYSSRGKLLYKASSATGVRVPGWGGPNTLGRVGDLDRDGRDDYVVGAWNLKGGGGAAAVLSGRTGKLLVAGFDVRPGDKLGQAVDGCGDMDGDGYPDFVSGGGTFGNPSVTAFSGKTGKPIWTWRSTYPFSDLGDTVRSGGIDVDRDGVPDVIAGAPGERRIPQIGGAFYVFSGRDGSVILRGESVLGGADLGSHLAIVGVQPGNPFPVFAVTEPTYKPSPTWTLGRLRVYRGSPGGVVGLGTSCRGSLPKAPKIGMRDLGGKAARITVYDANPGSPALLLVGVSRQSFGAIQLPFSLDPLGFRGCKLYTSVELVLATTAGKTGLAKGYASFDLPIALAATAKTTVYAQWLSVGTGNLWPGGVSDALGWRMK